MTTYGAYNAGLPCKNPHCKSAGKPHPNCQCYGGYSDGGEIEPFCSTARAHKKECEYFAEGGEAGDLFAPPTSDEMGSKPEKAAADDIYAPPTPEEMEKPYDFFEAPSQSEMEGIGTLRGKLAQAEALGRGIAGPLPGMAETALSGLGVPGLSPEDQAKRQEDFPVTNRIMQPLAMVSPSGPLASGIKSISTAAAKTGSKYIQRFIEGGLFQGADELSNAMLGKGDQESPVAHALVRIGGAGLLGSMFGGAEQLLSRAIPESARKIGKIAEEKFWDETANKITKWITSSITGYAGYKSGGAFGGFIGGASSKLLYDKFLSEEISKFIGRPIASGAHKYVVPTVLKALGSGSPDIGLYNLVHYAESVAKGARTMNKATFDLFVPGAQQEAKRLYSSPEGKKIIDMVTNGGVTQEIQNMIYGENAAQEPQGFAHGGEVGLRSRGGMLSTLEKHYPEQNVIINTARGRVSNYLNGLRPQNNFPKLAFDREPDVRRQQKTFHQAVEIAISPLSILNDIKNGTIQPDQVKHFNNMFPEINSALQKSLTEQITKQQLDGKRPSEKVRQGLSMFMGTALSSEYMPQNIQAAQSVFAARQQQQQPQTMRTKGSKAALSKSDDSFLTSGQARLKRQQRLT